MSWQPPQQQHTQARIPPAQVDLLDLSDPAPAPGAVPVDGDVFGMFGAPAPQQRKKPPPSSPPSSSLLQRIQARKGEQTPPKKAPPPPPQPQQPTPPQPQPQPHTQVRMPPPLAQPQQLPQIHQKAPPPQAQAQPQLKKPPPYSQPQQQQPQLKKPPPQQAPPQQPQTPNTNQKQYAMVFLHVYDLQPDPVQHQQQTQQPLTLADRALLGLSNVLPTLGMGLYHTSLEVMGHKYTFVGNAGVVVGSATGPDLGLPQGARWKEKIPLGPTFRTPQEAKEILTTLATLFFTPNAYDVMHRNCNHFTETSAMALILNEPPPHENASLLSYPKWLNRLAQTGAWAVTTAVGGPPKAPDPEKGSPCNVLQEATLAAGF